MSKNLPALRSRVAIASRGGSLTIRGGGGLTAADYRALWQAEGARKAAAAANALQAQAAAPRAATLDQALRREAAALEGRESGPAAVGGAMVRAALERGSGPMKGRRLEVLRAGALLLEHAQAAEAKRARR